MPAQDPKGQLGQRITAKLPPESLSVFFPNLANTVAEVGKSKPYGSGLEDPRAAGETLSLLSPPPPPPPWAGPPLIGRRGRSSPAPGTPLPAGHPGQGERRCRPLVPAALPGVSPPRREPPAHWLGHPQEKPEKRSGVPHCRKGPACAWTTRGHPGDVLHKDPIGRC